MIAHNMCNTMQEFGKDLFKWISKELPPIGVARAILFGAMPGVFIFYWFGNSLEDMVLDRGCPADQMPAFWVIYIAFFFFMGLLIDKVVKGGFRALAHYISAFSKFCRWICSRRVASTKRRRLLKNEIHTALATLSPDALAFLTLFRRDGIALLQMETQLLPYSVYQAGCRLAQQGIVVRSTRPHQPAQESFVFAPAASRMLRKLVFGHTSVNRQITLDLCHVAGCGASGSGGR